MSNPTYELMQVLSANQQRLISSHDSRTDAKEALPDEAAFDDLRGIWTTEAGDVYVIEVVATDDLAGS